MLPYTEVLIAPRTLPKTTSGKVRRSGVRQAYLAGERQWQSVSEVRGRQRAEPWQFLFFNIHLLRLVYSTCMDIHQ